MPASDAGGYDPIADVLARCASGDIPPNVALMQLFLRTADEAEASRALGGALWSAIEAGNADAAARLATMQRLWEDAADPFATVSAVHRVAARGAEDSERSRIAHISAIFDEVARISPAAGVALYSLGNAALLDAATAEIVALMEDWKLLGGEITALEIGCGSGRFLPALASRTRFTAGCDISEAMLACAARGIHAISNAAAIKTTGRDLAAFASNGFDLVYAIDSFPYLVEAGVAAAHIAEAARILKPDGFLLILNYSYRRDQRNDPVELAGFADTHGFAVIQAGERRLTNWDGIAFLLRKHAQA